MIYRGGYQAYQAAMRCLPILEFVAMIAHLLWNTGILAVVLLGVAQLVLVFTYCNSVVKKKALSPFT